MFKLSIPTSLAPLSVTLNRITLVDDFELLAKDCAVHAVNEAVVVECKVV